MLDETQNYQLNIIGYCSLNRDRLLQKFLQDGVENFPRLGGNYAIAIVHPSETYLITSIYGVCQYYYTVKNGQIFHDETVFGVLQKSGLSWSWNWEALGNLLGLEHLLENESLHPDIHRVPPGTILHFKNGQLNQKTLTWDEIHPQIYTDPDTALDDFNREIQCWTNTQPVVSMSGGFDSRLILSSFLRQGCKPDLLTMGFDRSTDVIISRQIAKKFNLKLAVSQLNLEDYLTYGSQIVRLTNGTKTARHWHTYLYVKQAQLNPNSSFFVGTNGEFARTFFYDRGWEAIEKQWKKPEASLAKLWQGYLKQVFQPEELHHLTPELGQQLDETGRRDRVQHLIDLSYHQFLPGLDRFYLEQRVKNFMGNGLTLYGANIGWRAPFLSQNWVNTIWHLSRIWKLGSHWHRFAIQKNCAQLLAFPEEGKSLKMSAKPPLFYWKRNHQYPVIPYANYAEWFATPTIADFVRDRAQMLSDIIDSKIVDAIVEEHQKQQNRTPAIAFLVSTIFWKDLLKQNQLCK
ncbi:hypothetical protein [Oxynema aestuarii]|jgi:hypothetical protein|uniref:asparagine synthase (glutamine-hydrolyzing) n=1 Tax=Oxynema aestuarii AP17 TaxID=2064643 RepID=A0A6H1TY82_9CYAN|nr:hypothetical protein [Oxynema aestuarii]QIZ71176.1 hypothetical protein HCG48_11805 [Oxynema aestuarii AP17]RMH76969.1 MAG: hypothetical protein D6680_07100 [Cyanobacteria bacterium J007]